MAFERNFVHRTRHAPWGGGSGAGQITHLGVDWSSADFVWAFSDTKGGTALITLVNAAPSAQGVSATYDSSIVHPRTGMIVGGTKIVPHILETALESLAGWGSTEKVLYYDLLVTPSGLVQRPLCYGTLTVYPGIGD